MTHFPRNPVRAIWALRRRRLRHRELDLVVSKGTNPTLARNFPQLTGLRVTATPIQPFEAVRGLRHSWMAQAYVFDDDLTPLRAYGSSREDALNEIEQRVIEHRLDLDSTELRAFA